MAEIIKMPKMSDTMTEGTISKWLKKVGDKVKSGDTLAEVETDKATMELENYEDGYLLHIGIEEGNAAPVDGLIAIIGKEGEDISAILNGGETQVKAEEKTEVEAKATTAATPEVKPTVAKQKVNAEAVTMPKMSDTMTEGTIVNWLKNVGDKVKSGDVLAEVETDKATMELENYTDGYLLYIGAKAGEAVKVDDIIAIIGEQNADFNALLSGNDTVATTTSESQPSQAEIKSSDSSATEVEGSEETFTNENGDRVKISPLARKLAEQKGIKISALKGSGENGRIVKKDVENYKAPLTSPTDTAKEVKQNTAPTSAAVYGKESYEEVNVSQMRKTIARRLSESLFTAPHFYLTMEINMDKAISARKSINEYAESKVSFNDLVVKASAIALKKHPKVNSSWLGDKIRFNHHIHIGIAVAVEEGLLVPVVRFADGKTITTISSEIKELGAKAKNKQLQPADWEGNTFTISNLGMFGIEEFTAIINPPDACILAVGGIKETVIVKDGQMAVGNVMKVTLSCDHRVVDGATGAAFLQTLKALLEDPIRLLA